MMTLQAAVRKEADAETKSLKIDLEGLQVELRETREMLAESERKERQVRSFNFTCIHRAR